MFSWLKPDPQKKLRNQYAAKMKEAMLLQRGGDMKGFAQKTAEAEEINRQLQALSSAG